MHHIRQRIILCITAIFGIAVTGSLAQEPASSLEILISIADQKMVVLRDGGLIRKYPVSTSKFGAGDAYKSYKTPLGRLRVCDKVGDDLMPGSVIKHREATGEVLDVNAPGRDPIVTRILWLDGEEEQNRNAKARGIYIHGTPEEKRIGEPVSWGCIRMRSRDVMELFDGIPVGTQVSIIAEKLPRLHKYEPPKPVIIAVRPPPPTPAPTPVPAVPTPSVTASRIAAARTLPKSVPSGLPTPTAVTASRIVSTKWSENPAPAISAPPISVPAMNPPVIAAAPAATRLAAKSLPEIAEGGRKRKKLMETPDSRLGDAGAFDAMKGSILFAGLPDGPAPQSVVPSEPKKQPPVELAQPGKVSLPEAAQSKQTPIEDPLNIDAPTEKVALSEISAPVEHPEEAPVPPEGAHPLAAHNPPPTPGISKPVDRQ